MNEINPLVSVVMAAYKSNHEYFKTAIQSVLNQKYTNYELIIVDDSPTTELQELVEAYDNTSIYYHHNETSLGVAANHNKGFFLSRGKYIAILNHDDELHSDFLNELIIALEKDDNISLVFCDNFIIDSKGSVLLEETDNNTKVYKRFFMDEGKYKPFYDLVTSQSIPMAMGSIFRKSSLVANIPEWAGPAYDFWLTVHLSLNNNGAYFYKKRLSYYRVHDASLVANSDMKWLIGLGSCWRYLLDINEYKLLHKYSKLKASNIFSVVSMHQYKAGKRLNTIQYGITSFFLRANMKVILLLILCAMPTFMGIKIIDSIKEKQNLVES